MDLHVKYRPKQFSEMVGQRDVVRSLERALSKKAGHALLFGGPSGTGKTTLARIVATHLGCSEWNIQEVNAAMHTGVDSMRELMGNLVYAGLGKTNTKMVIVDECHALSSSAWQSLLKMVEEPPEHLYWAFCTTEQAKVPKTIQTRCLIYNLEPLSAEEVLGLLQSVAKAESMETPEDVLFLCAETCDGSPRRALTSLAKVTEAKNRKVAARILREAEEGGEQVINFCRLLLKTNSWEQLSASAKELQGTNPESVRRVVLDYMTKVAFGAKEPRRAAGVLSVIAAFSEPYPPGGQLYPLLLSIGTLCFNE